MCWFWAEKIRIIIKGRMDGRTDEVKRTRSRKNPEQFSRTYHDFPSRHSHNKRHKPTQRLAFHDATNQRIKQIRSIPEIRTPCCKVKQGKPQDTLSIVSSLCLEHLQHCVRVCIFEHDVIRHRSVALRIPAHNKHQQSKIHFQHKQAR